MPCIHGTGRHIPIVFPKGAPCWHGNVTPIDAPLAPVDVEVAPRCGPSRRSQLIMKEKQITHKDCWSFVIRYNFWGPKLARIDVVDSYVYFALVTEYSQAKVIKSGEVCR